MAQFRINPIAVALVTISIATFHGAASAQSAGQGITVLTPAADPLKNAVLIGRVASAGMVLQLELEGGGANVDADGQSADMGRAPTRSQ